MTNLTEPSAPATPPGVETLAQLLGESTHAKVLVDEVAENLSSVTDVLNHPAAAKDPAQTIDVAIELSGSAEGKAQEAADKLTVVNRALAREVHARHALEVKLDSVIQETAQAVHVSLHDDLTGLPNRALFNDRLEHGLAQAKRHGFTLSVMFIDLNGFKAINDHYGHATGDAVLQSIADRLLENTREDDTVSRHGGDEFLYLLTSIDDDTYIAQIADKIAFAIQQPCRLTVGDLVVKASIGISCYPKDGSTPAELIESADKAMYQAKRAQVDYVFA